MGTVYFPRDAGSDQAGIRIQYVRRIGMLDIGGWYDSFVDIEGEQLSLRDFFVALGISEKDCAAAWSRGQEPEGRSK